MRTLPPLMIPFLLPFRTIFSTGTTFSKICLLFIGATLCRGARTVCSCLTALGMQGEKIFSNYHRVLNRSKWKGFEGSKILLNIILTFTKGDVLLIVDEHLERRRGKNIQIKDVYRDPVASTKSWLVKCLGIKWVVLAVAIKFPWSKRHFALPFFCLAKKPKRDTSHSNKINRTGIDILCIMLYKVRKWHPNLSFTLVGDGEFAKVKLAKTCICLSIGLVSRMRLDARLHNYPTRKEWRGKSVKLGERILPKEKWKRNWQQATITGYGGLKKTIRFESYNCLWYAGKPEVIIPVLAIWVKLGSDEIILMSTDTVLSPQEVIEAYIKRWNIEVTFRECRDYLGIETQKQWSNNAVERSTPLLFCMYSLITLIGHTIYKEKGIVPRVATWYQKKHLTFSDLLSRVKMEIWKEQSNPNSLNLASSDKLSNNDWIKMEDVLAQCF